MKKIVFIILIIVALLVAIYKWFMSSDDNEEEQKVEEIETASEKEENVKGQTEEVQANDTVNETINK